MNRILFLLAPFGSAERDTVPVTIWERLSPEPKIVLAVPAPKIPNGGSGTLRFLRFPQDANGSVYDVAYWIGDVASLGVERGTWTQCHVFAGERFIGSFVRVVNGQFDARVPDIRVEENKPK